MSAKKLSPMLASIAADALADAAGEVERDVEHAIRRATRGDHSALDDAGRKQARLEKLVAGLGALEQIGGAR